MLGDVTERLIKMESTHQAVLGSLAEYADAELQEGEWRKNILKGFARYVKGRGNDPMVQVKGKGCATLWSMGL